MALGVVVAGSSARLAAIKPIASTPRRQNGFEFLSREFIVDFRSSAFQCRKSEVRNDLLFAEALPNIGAHLAALCLGAPCVEAPGARISWQFCFHIVLAWR